MKLKEINQIQFNGSTVLHVAAWYGHYEIVECLLKHGCSITTVNKYEKTAAQEFGDERIRHLIQSSTAVLDNDGQMNDHTPQSKWCQIYQNKSAVATRIMKLRLRTYLTYQFKTNEFNRTDHIKKIFAQCASEQNSSYERGLDALRKFETSKNPEHLIYLYTTETPFCGYMYRNQDEVFFMELIIGLTVFHERFFVGCAYRGLRMKTTDLDVYLCSWHHHSSFFEIRSIMSTSASRNVAELFIGQDRNANDTIGILLIYDFPERCETAIELKHNSEHNLPALSSFEAQEEVLIIPGTFFEVTSIEKSSLTDLTIIKLRNIPVSREVLLKTINELK